MSDEFTPRVRALLDRLEPPALPTDFADRLVAKAEATSNLPPLPPYQRRHTGRGRRIALAVGIAGLVSVAAAAAVVPADVWRKIPVIGGIVELISPAPAPSVPTRSRPVPAAPVTSDSSTPESVPEAAQAKVLPAAEAREAVPARQDRTVVRQNESGTKTDLPAALPEATERTREPLSVHELPPPEAPVMPPARATTSVVVDRQTEPSPVRPSERIEPTSETRQQARERTSSTREIARERIERRERRTATRPRRTD